MAAVCEYFYPTESKLDCIQYTVHGEKYRQLLGKGNDEMQMLFLEVKTCNQLLNSVINQPICTHLKSEIVHKQKILSLLGTKSGVTTLVNLKCTAK